MGWVAPGHAKNRRKASLMILSRIVGWCIARTVAGVVGQPLSYPRIVNKS